MVKVSARCFYSLVDIIIYGTETDAKPRCNAFNHEGYPHAHSFPEVITKKGIASRIPTQFILNVVFPACSQLIDNRVHNKEVS